MKSESLLLTLLYVVTATAFISTLNARGIIRLATSFALSLFCLAASIFQTNTYLAHKEAITDMLPPSGAVAELPPTFALSPESNRVSVVGRKPAPRNTQNRMSPELHEIADSARQLALSLTAINPSLVMQVSDEEYAQMRENARACDWYAQRLKVRLAGIPTGSSMGRQESEGVLDSPVEYLVDAAHDLNRFFNAETDSEEKIRSGDFRRNLQAAKAALNKTEVLAGVQ